MFEDSDVKCPYYRKMYRAKDSAYVNRIRCEGMVNGTNLETNFAFKGHAEKYKCQYCDSYEYSQCPLAKLIESKYE